VTLGETVQAWAEEARSKGAATFPLIRPISVNNLFENRRGKGRVRTRKYDLWRADQMGAIMAAGPRLHVSGPVDIVLMAPAGSQADTDNIQKGYIDAAVAMGLMDDDRNVVSVATMWIPAHIGVGVIAPIHPQTPSAGPITGRGASFHTEDPR